MTRVGTAARAGGRELRRTPVLLGLLVVAPAYVVYFFTAVAPATAARLVVDGAAVRTTLDSALPAFTTPMTAALLSGVAGLFLLGSAAEADGRLCIAGYSPVEVVLARLAVLSLIVAVATAVSTAVMWTAYQPEAPVWFVAGTLLTALIYGLVGVVVGLLLDRLTGVYVVLFGSMVDLFVFQNPLATDAPDLATWLPGHYPLAVAMAGGFTTDPAWTALRNALLVAGLLSVLAVWAFVAEL